MVLTILNRTMPGMPPAAYQKIGETTPSTRLFARLQALDGAPPAGRAVHRRGVAARPGGRPAALAAGRSPAVTARVHVAGMLQEVAERDEAVEEKEMHRAGRPPDAIVRAAVTSAAEPPPQSSANMTKSAQGRRYGRRPPPARRRVSSRVSEPPISRIGCQR